MEIALVVSCVVNVLLTIAVVVLCATIPYLFWQMRRQAQDIETLDGNLANFFESLGLDGHAPGSADSRIHGEPVKSNGRQYHRNKRQRGPHDAWENWSNAQHGR